MKKFLSIIALVIGFTSVSKADLMVEPYLGYNIAKFSAAGTGFSFTGKPSGTILGLRLAYKIPMFWFGLDASTGSAKMTPSDPSFSNDNVTKTTLGAVFGVEFPILLRAWIGYGFSNKLANKDSSNSDFEGTNTKLGVGFTGLPLVSINLEIINDSFTKYGGQPIKNTFSKFDSSSYLLSVSLPVNL
jgi:hypothetical protein